MLEIKKHFKMLFCNGDGNLGNKFTYVCDALYLNCTMVRKTFTEMDSYFDMGHGVNILDGMQKNCCMCLIPF